MNYKERTIEEEARKKPFYIVESIPWASDSGSNQCPDPLFTRRESVLAHQSVTNKSLHAKNPLDRIAARKKRRSARRSSLAREKGSKRLKEDLYDANNVVFFETRMHPVTVSIKKEASAPKIFIPDFKAVDTEYYKDVDEMIEEDDEARYSEMHRPYELAESCYKFLDSGQGLPEELKGGLKIKIKLPSNPNELPLLI
eukprot:TRINITY_DN2408_c0_g1_i8.p1 TRINITY_DN2408_c0_g1~~TRINITY_DN2408_c0_g1_i8.p1  ORF type:complete len:198 (+),score=38.43 TRINITY_DN2408_c0_g1_i8:132-725(+)